MFTGQQLAPHWQYFTPLCLQWKLTGICMPIQKGAQVIAVLLKKY